MRKYLLFFFILVIGKSYSQTEVSGTISSNTSWTEANSPYTLNGNVVISMCDLQIESGVVVNLNSHIITLDGENYWNGSEVIYLGASLSGDGVSFLNSSSSARSSTIRNDDIINENTASIYYAGGTLNTCLFNSTVYISLAVKCFAKIMCF